MRPLKVLSSSDLGDINTFLDGLKDGAGYKSRLKVLEDQKKEINDLIKVYGKVSEIEGLRVRAKQFSESAEKAGMEAAADRNAAKEYAAVILSRASRKAEDKVADANAKFIEREDALKVGEADVGRREKAAEEMLDQANDRMGQAEERMKTAVAIKALYEDASAALKAAASKAVKAL